LPLKEISVDYVNGDVNCETLNFEYAFEFKKPVYEIHAHLAVNTHLLVHIVTTRVVLDLIISNTVVK
jgi:hypothetical protein